MQLGQTVLIGYIVSGCSGHLGTVKLTSVSAEVFASLSSRKHMKDTPIVLNTLASLPRSTAVDTVLRGQDASQPQPPCRASYNA